jgi:hypothetical protein
MASTASFKAQSWPLAQARALAQDRAQQRGALAHAARERRGIGVLESFEAEAAQQRGGRGARPRERLAGELGAERHVLEHGPPRQQQIAPHHVGDRARLPDDVVAVEPHDSQSGIWRPAMTLNSVDLPQPLGPIRATKSLARSERSTCSIAATRPAPSIG